MNKYLGLGLLLWAINVCGQTSIEKVFVNMPERLCPILSMKNRNELFEYHRAKMGDSIANRFGNQSFLLRLDSAHQHLIIRLSLNSTLEMKIMPLGTGNCIGIINTVCGPVCHSGVKFYDSLWNEIPLHFLMPGAIEWVRVNDLPGDIDKKWLDKALETSFVTLSFDDELPQIEARNCTADFLSDEEAKKIRPYFIEQKIVYQLEGDNWVKR